MTEVRQLFNASDAEVMAGAAKDIEDVVSQQTSGLLDVIQRIEAREYDIVRRRMEATIEKEYPGTSLDDLVKKDPAAFIRCMVSMRLPSSPGSPVIPDEADFQFTVDDLRRLRNVKEDLEQTLDLLRRAAKLASGLLVKAAIAGV